jgi:hypothetical protein
MTSAAPLERIATCSCGQLRIVCEGEPIRVSICHCYACQKRSGSVFAAQARWPNERVTPSGRAKEWVRVGDEGGKATFRFCPECGSTVYYELDGMPGVTAVAVGAFADATFPGPIYSVYEARKHGWVVVPADIEHYD